MRDISLCHIRFIFLYHALSMLFSVDIHQSPGPSGSPPPMPDYHNIPGYDPRSRSGSDYRTGAVPNSFNANRPNYPEEVVRRWPARIT